MHICCFHFLHSTANRAAEFFRRCTHLIYVRVWFFSIDIRFSLFFNDDGDHQPSALSSTHRRDMAVRFRLHIHLHYRWDFNENVICAVRPSKEINDMIICLYIVCDHRVQLRAMEVCWRCDNAWSILLNRIYRHIILRFFLLFYKFTNSGDNHFNK